MNYIITCISHKRHENIESFFKIVGSQNVVFFVKDETDKKMYLQNGAKEVIVSGSLMKSRNASLDYCFAQNKTCVQLSDDLEKIMVNDFTGKRTHDYVCVTDVLENIRKTTSVIHKLDRSQSRSTRGVVWRLDASDVSIKFNIEGEGGGAHVCSV